jgi:hypothetical protein
MSVIKAAKKYAEMEKAGLTIAQISAMTGVDQTAIKERLQLLTLTPDEQDKVVRNKISFVQALNLCQQRKRAQAEGSSVG